MVGERVKRREGRGKIGERTGVEKWVKCQNNNNNKVRFAWLVGSSNSDVEVQKWSNPNRSGSDVDLIFPQYINICVCLCLLVFFFLIVCLLVSLHLG